MAVGLTFQRLRDDLGADCPPELHLRVVLEVLKALQPVHTDLTRPPPQRCHGTLNPGCIVINDQGTLSLFWQPTLRPTDAQRPYLAPEVRRGSDPDQQADIYSVGLMLYEAVTGRRVTSAAPERNLPTLAPWADPLLDVAIEALYRSPARRWASARAFAEAVTALAHGHVATRQQLARSVRALSAAKDRSGVALSAYSPSATPAATPAGQSPSEPRTSERPTQSPLPGSSAVSGELMAVAQPASHPPSVRSAAPPGVRHSGLWFSARRTPGFAWLGLTAAAVLSALLVGFWAGSQSPNVAVVTPVAELEPPAEPALERGEPEPAEAAPAGSQQVEAAPTAEDEPAEPPVGKDPGAQRAGRGGAPLAAPSGVEPPKQRAPRRTGRTIPQRNPAVYEPEGI